MASDGGAGRRSGSDVRWHMLTVDVRWHMLTVKVEGAPAVHLVYDRARAFEESAVTVLDQTAKAPWSYREVVWQTLILTTHCGDRLGRLPVGGGWHATCTTGQRRGENRRSTRSRQNGN